MIFEQVSIFTVLYPMTPAPMPTHDKSMFGSVIKPMRPAARQVDEPAYVMRALESHISPKRRQAPYSQRPDQQQWPKFKAEACTRSSTPRLATVLTSPAATAAQSSATSTTAATTKRYVALRSRILGSD